MERVGILGGTFDPIHVGHIQMAEAALRGLELSEVLIVPDGRPPHKGQVTPGRHRLAMARLAAEERPGLRVSDVELRRRGVTYTVDTLAHLRAKHPQRDYIYIVGSDTLMVLESWRAFGRAAALLAGVAVARREGDDLAAIRRQAAYLTDKYGLHIYLLEESVAAVSSTQVRRLAARDQRLEGLVCPAVAQYIRRHRLYRDPMLEELRRTMTPPRYRHTLGVEQTALSLAARYGVDQDKAQLAALLHDCAKHMEQEDMKALVRRWGIDTAPGEEDSRALLHAAAGMAAAQEKFSVTDPQVLSAIRWHTTGKPGMSRLDQIIYLADMIEPGRKDFPGLDLIRRTAWHDLDQAMLIAARRTVAYVKGRGMPLNPRTVELLDSLEAAQAGAGPEGAVPARPEPVPQPGPGPESQALPESQAFPEPQSPQPGSPQPGGAGGREKPRRGKESR